MSTVPSQTRTSERPREPHRFPSPGDGLSPAIGRLKQRLLTAPYEICLARARHLTESFRHTEGMDPALRMARGLRRCLERQSIRIYPDEQLAGSKTEKYLASPLSVERGDFLRTLQLELDILHRKQRPFRMSAADKQLFSDELLPYWNGRTLRDVKARYWQQEGIIATRPSLPQRLRGWRDGLRFVRYLGCENLRKMLGANYGARLSWSRVRNLFSLRYELAHNNPTPAVYCMDVQGHLCLGLDRAITLGFEQLIEQIKKRLEQQPPGDHRRRDFLQAMLVCLEAAIRYAERFSRLAEHQARQEPSETERHRLSTIAEHCRQVPRKPARTFHEALQAAWLTLVIGEIQFGSMDVFAVGRLDQYLWPLFERDRAAGVLSESQARALLQEFFLKLSANVTPTPELGMETNAVLGNSQHCVTVGGLTPDGSDGTNELSFLILDAYEQLNGTVNQVCVRLHDQSPQSFVRRAVQVFRRTNGLAFYNDRVIVPALQTDGYTAEHGRDYCIVGCVETCGHSNTQGCVAGHDMVLPAVLLMTLSRGRIPPPAWGQTGGSDVGDPASFTSFEQLWRAFERQLAGQIEVMVRAIAAKDRAHRQQLPAPYVSALVAGCIEAAADVTAGGAQYDFTTIVFRGLATTVDSLLAIERLVYARRELPLNQLLALLLDDYSGKEPLRQRTVRELPKFGHGNEQADGMALRLVEFIHGQVQRYQNVRGGKYRVSYFSLGNHVIDGILLGATPDGRKRGQPISNGVSPSNLASCAAGPIGALKTVAKLPAAQASSGIALNLRFHPNFIASDRGLETFATMLQTYFRQGGMHLQPNFVSTELLRKAQKNPAEYRDLIVKVSGYSACFVDLGRSIQEDIIARAEYAR